MLKTVLASESPEDDSVPRSALVADMQVSGRDEHKYGPATLSMTKINGNLNNRYNATEEYMDQ